MSFRVTRETLEALEWPQVLALLRDECRTAQGRKRLAEAETEMMAEVSAHTAPAPAGGNIHQRRPALLFEPSLGAIRLRLAETDEARALLDDEQTPPLGSTADLTASLSRATKGGVLEIAQLIDVRSTLEILHQSLRFVRAHAERFPRLAEILETAEEQPDLEKEINRCIGPSGEIRDQASARLAEARREIVRLANELQKKLDRYVRNPDISRHLSDTYYTVRNDRYVLPVKADSRGRVRGIVHDASRSGTTLFIEPEGVVDVNNRLKQAELDTEREIRRVLGELSRQVAESADAIRIGLDGLSRLDLAFARGRLSQKMEATSPTVEEGAVFELPGLRHPLIPSSECVANDLRLGDDFTVLILSGPNAGGKTVSMKAIGLAALFARAGMHVPCEDGARVDAVDHVLADIGDHQDIGENLSTFSAHMANLAEIVGEAGPRSLVVLDEIGVGTDPGEGAALAQAILETLASRGARVVTTTHYNLLKEMAEVDERFYNASVDFDPESLAPTYRIHMGTPGASSASTVAARMGMPSEILQRADSLLERDDRKLEQMLSELAATRVKLASEKEKAVQVRTESEVVRNEYRVKLERLQERRDELFLAMRNDLDLAFKQAHAEVAGVVRELQRGTSSQKAAAARQELQGLETKSREKEREAGFVPPKRPSSLRPVDWRRAKPGDRIRIASGSMGTLESLPDRKGRAGVRIGGKRLVLAAEDVGQAGPQDGSGSSPRDAGRVRVERAEPPTEEREFGGGTQTCDLRGERVIVALDRLSEALDRAAADGAARLRVVHGIGTGALRQAVREFLGESRYVDRFEPADPDDGGEGVTLVELA
jgi:DNA mismatch repair protein MutS2